MMNPDISVVVVTWNARDLVRKCLDSLVAQSGGIAQQIIVVDNASSDGTAELVGSSFSAATLVRNEQNLGFARANNLGLARAQGRYIALVNSDVVLPAGCLARLVRYMDEQPTIGMLGPKMLAADGSTRRSCMRFPTLWRCFCQAVGLDRLLRGVEAFRGFEMKEFDHETAADVDVLNGWFWVVRREAWVAVGGLDERFFMYGEDIDWCKRFQEQGWRRAFYPGAAAVHYGGGSSARSPVQFYVEMQRANLQYWRSHHGRLAQWGFVAVMGAHHLLRTAFYALVFAFKPSRRSESAFKVERSAACLRWLSRPEGLRR